MGLTRKQRLFIDAYLDPSTKGQADAACKAGFSVRRSKITAHELMRNPEVKSEIERRLAAKTQAIETKAKSGEVTRESLSQECDDVIETCMTAGAGGWQVQSRLKAIELKAKLHGLLTEKVELGLDERLIELLEAGRKRAGLTPTLPSVPPAIEGELIATAD